jgi:hypothetical protein
VRRPRLGSTLGVLVIAGTAGCSKPGDVSKPSASATSSALASPPLAPSALDPSLIPATRPACRALLVSGRATVEGVVLAMGNVLDGEHWVELEAGASVSLRHTTSSREFQLIGPARVLPCRQGSEQVLLARGQMSTSANLGVRPGAEVLIATPEGTVRYGDAALDVEVGDQGLSVRVKQGEAFVEPPGRDKPRFKNPVHSGGEAHVAPRHAPASALLAACQAAARAAHDSAERVLAPASDADAGSLGQRASTQMRDRAKARIACAVAAAQVGMTRDDAERQSLSAAVAHADELWQSVPKAISGQKN